MKRLILLALLTIFTISQSKTGKETVAGFPTGYFKGVVVMPENNPNCLSWESTINEIPYLLSQGVNFIAIVPMVFTNSTTTSEIYPTEDTPNSSSLSKFIQAVHSNGMGVFLKPMLVTENGLFTEMNPDNITTFFSNYTYYWSEFAKIAESENVEGLSIGTELKLISGNYSYEWTQLISTIRSIYSGNLTYSSLPYGEWKDVIFWDQLDWIGIDGYVKTATRSDPHPSIDKMITIMNYYFEDIKSWKDSREDLNNKRVILTETGFPSTNICAVMNTVINDCKAPYFSANDTCQENGYIAEFNSLSQNTDIITGSFFFRIDLPCSPDWIGVPPLIPPAEDWNCSWTPRNKPAMNVMAQAYLSSP